MLHDNDLKPCDGLNFRLSGEVAEKLSLDVLKALIKEKNEQSYDLPIKFSRDSVKHGGLFNSSTEECMIITNKEHPDDYFRYCAILRKNGRHGTLQFFYCGQSVLTGKKNQEAERSKKLSGMLINALVRVDQTKYDEEYQYYADLDNLLEETCQ